MTKPELARQMLERVFTAKLPCRWVTGDSVYGSDRSLRLWLEQQPCWFVLGIKSDEALWHGFAQIRADQLPTQLPADAWHQLSCGKGAKGERIYDGALLPLVRWGQSADILHAWLVRRNLMDVRIRKQTI